MNEETMKMPKRIRWGIKILLCCLVYLAVVTGNYVCLKRHVYDPTVGMTVFFGLGAITFVLAVAALFKPSN